jgi:hypothetical protein
VFLILGRIDLSSFLTEPEALRFKVLFWREDDYLFYSVGSINYVDCDLWVNPFSDKHASFEVILNIDFK